MRLRISATIVHSTSANEANLRFVCKLFYYTLGAGDRNTRDIIFFNNLTTLIARAFANWFLNSLYLSRKRRTCGSQGLQAIKKTKATRPWSFLVLETGIEPVRYRYRGILSPLRLPVPPLQRNLSYPLIIPLAFFVVK